MCKAKRSILVVTGEVSGEEHAARVLEELKTRLPGDLHVYGSGGGKMARQGVELLARVESLSAIGPVAALGNLGRYISLYRRILRRTSQDPPDLALLVDFPDFNLKLATRLRRQGVRICYFISPQVWAWRAGRAHDIGKVSDRLLVILPFEVEFYSQRGIEAHYVGHPVARLRDVQVRRRDDERDSGVARIVLMPGSRRKEIDHIFPVQLDAAAHLSRRTPARFRVLAAPGLGQERISLGYDSWCRRGGETLDLDIVSGPVEEHLPWANCAIIKSGTSTLQAMALGIPFAMVYRMSKLSYSLMRPFVETRRFCLANLVAEQEIAPEFVQEGARPEAIADYLIELLTVPGRMREVKQNLEIASRKLGNLDAYQETASHIAELLGDQ